MLKLSSRQLMYFNIGLSFAVRTYFRWSSHALGQVGIDRVDSKFSHQVGVSIGVVLESGNPKHCFGFPKTQRYVS